MPKCLACVSERDEHATFIGSVTRSSHNAKQLQPLQKRRDGAGVHAELCTEISHCARLCSEKLEHHKVLRECQAKWLQKRLMQPRHSVCCAVESKRQLLAYLAFLEITLFCHLSSQLLSSALHKVAHMSQRFNHTG
ncbi:hypothetical protein SAMN04490188_4371 [Pseudomonas kilonensis]|uniref:Uncharacterized protein n=1 Tax=Pseudomonas kilonensis TaxID=132476 RepID=A0ABY0ZDR5_9PSED|nr:hypothetical protein SAMN04490188_4371 [Pseudomonas kilonensis]